jgi:hypothetical protein
MAARLPSRALSRRQAQLPGAALTHPSQQPRRTAFAVYRRHVALFCRRNRSARTRITFGAKNGVFLTMKRNCCS